MKREVAPGLQIAENRNFRGDLSDFKPGGRVTVHKSEYVRG